MDAHNKTHSTPISFTPELMDLMDNILYRYRLGNNPGFEYISPAIEDLTGYPREEFYENPRIMHNILHPDYRYLFNIYSSGKNGLNIVRHKIIRKDNTIRWIERKEVLLTDRKGNLMAVEGVIYYPASKEEKIRLEQKDHGELSGNHEEYVIRMDPKGRLLYGNPLYCKLLGKDLESIQNEELISYVHDEDRRLVRRALEEIQNPPHTFYMEQRTYMGGRLYWIAWHGTAILNKKGAVESIIGVGWDITEMKKNAQVLEESEKRYRDFMENTLIGIYIVQKGRLVYCNKGLALMLEYEQPDVLIDRPVTAFTVLGDRKKVEKELYLCETGEKKLCRREFMLLNSRGFSFPAEVLGQQSLYKGEPAVYGIIRDLSQHKKALEALRKSEERFRLTFQTSPDSININRLRDGLYVDINEGFTTLTGYTREEVIGRTSIEIDIWYNPEDRKKMIRELKRKGRVDNLEAKFRIKSGTVLTGLISATIIELEGESHIISVTRSIEERIRLSRERERLLKETEKARKNLQEVFERISDGVVALDRKGYYTYVNHKAAKMLNRKKPEDLLGRNIWNEYPEGITQAFFKAYQKAMKTQKPVCLEAYYSSWKRWFENRIYPAPEGMTIYFTEVTERRKTEEMLRISEEKYRKLIQNAPDAFFQSDERGKFILVNRHAVKITKYKSSELLKRGVSDLLSPDEIEKSPIQFDKLKKGKTIQKEWMLRQKDGKEIPVEVVSRMMPDHTFISFIRDISERKKTEKQLEIQSAALENAANSVIITDADGNIEWVNKAFTTITGYAKEEAVGKNPRILKSGRHDEVFYKQMWDTITRGEIWRGKIVNQRKDGTHYTEELTIAPIFNNLGDITHYVGIQLDVTKQEKTLQKLQITLNRLHRLSDHLNDILEQERLEISRNLHDHLGQILTAVKIDISWLSRKWRHVPPEVKERLEETKSLIDNAIKTIQDITTGLRPSMLDELGLWDAVEWLCQEMTKHSGIRIEAEITRRDLVLPEHYILPVYRVVQEAVTNIVRHSKATEAKLKVKTEKDSVIISVYDNGCGIPIEKLESQENFGLIGMQERIEILGGEFFLIRHDPGTEVLFKLPLNES